MLIVVVCTSTNLCNPVVPRRHELRVSIACLSTLQVAEFEQCWWPDPRWAELRHRLPRCGLGSIVRVMFVDVGQLCIKTELL